MASRHGHREVVEVLLANSDDLNVNSQDTNGHTALIAASEYGHPSKLITFK